MFELNWDSLGSCEQKLAQSCGLYPDWRKASEAIDEGADAALAGPLLSVLSESDQEEDALKCAQLLIEKGALPEDTPVEGLSALERAAQHGRHALCQMLSKHCGNKSINKALARAVEQADADLIIILCEAGGRVHGSTHDGRRYLNVLASNNQLSGQAALEALVNCGADVNEQDEHNRTALCTAAAYGSLSSVKTLLYLGATVNRRGPHGYMALDFALGTSLQRKLGSKDGLGHQHVLCAQELLRAGAQVDRAIDQISDLSRLWKSSEYFEPSWFDALVQLGAQPTAFADSMEGLLRVCSSVGQEAEGYKLAQWALAHGVPPNLRASDGLLPWEAAQRFGKNRLAGLLLSASDGESLVNQLESDERGTRSGCL